MVQLLLSIIPLLLSPGAAWVWDAVDCDECDYRIYACYDPGCTDVIAVLELSKEFACDEEGRCSDKGLLCLDGVRPATGSAVPVLLTRFGEAFARVSTPHGGGSRDLGTIRDQDKPEVGSGSNQRQYDTYDGPNDATEDWVGYLHSNTHRYERVIFQEGKHFFNGGWFESLSVQVRRGGVWVDVSGLSITPRYPGNNGINYETFELTFTPIKGEGIRIYGIPGGTAAFISVAELEVYGPPEPTGPIFFDIRSFNEFGESE